MPYRKKIYICPVCREEFEDEREAEDHLSDHEVDEGIVYDCEYCGEHFETYKEAEKHEVSCACTPPGCESCNHFESGLRRHYPCKRLNLDTDLSPCELYQNAKVI